MVGKAVLFWIGVLVALMLLVQFAPGTAKSLDHWMDYSPLVAVVLGFAVVLWRRQKRAATEQSGNDSDPRFRDEKL